MATSTPTVYFNDFDGAPTVAAGIDARLTLGGAATVPTVAPYQADYGQILRNDTSGSTVLTLTGLKPHSTVDIGFTLAMLDSWDSSNGSPAPDWFDLFVDGARVASYTYNNASGTVRDIDGGTLSLTFKAGGAGFQYGDDESWAIDRLEVALGGATVIEGTDGDDTLSAVDHPEGATLLGGAGNDHLTGGAGRDDLHGGAGQDVLEGDALDQLYGDEGDDTLTGGSLIDGGPGADRMRGGPGPTTFVVDSRHDKVLESAHGPMLVGPRWDRHLPYVDTVQASVDWVLGPNLEVLVLKRSADLRGTGNDANNVLIGNLGRNVLDGGAGWDQMKGHAGNDTYVVRQSLDTVLEYADDGIDTVKSYVDYRLGHHLERLELLGSRDLRGTGNELANQLTGNAGHNRLDGRGGADTMAGGAGDDTYVLGNLHDAVIELAGGGHDTVRASRTHHLSAQVEDLVLTGYGASAGAGNALDNTITGNAAANRLNGGAGADTFVLNGFAAADTVGDFTSGVDRLRIDMHGIAVGDGDALLEGAVVRPNHDGFAPTAELVIVQADIRGPITADSAAARIGHASAAYAPGDRVLFAVDNGRHSALFLFQSLDGDTHVEAGELTLLARLNNTPSTDLGDYLFGP